MQVLPHPEDLQQMSVPDIHERWPITVRVPDIMPDYVLDAILHDMAHKVYNWRHGSHAGVSDTVHQANVRADELLGVRQSA